MDSETTSMITFGGQLFLSFLLSIWLASKRRIGEEWGLFFGLTFPFFLGLILILLSPKKSNPKYYVNRTPNNYIKALAILLGCIGILGILGGMNNLLNPFYDYISRYRIYSALLLAIGLLGLGIYLIYPPKRVEQ